METLRDASATSRNGTSLSHLKAAAVKVGFKALLGTVAYEHLETVRPPFVAFWRQRHYLVVYKIRRSRVYISDPAFGLATLSKEEFIAGWSGNGAMGQGAVLFLEPTPDLKSVSETEPKSNFHFLVGHLRPLKKNFMILISLVMLIGGIEIIFPILAQKVVDDGILRHDLNFISLVLIGQLVLIFSRTVVEFVRNRVLLQTATKLNISIISRFLERLMQLPLSFFEKKRIGDILQRVTDQRRIEAFFTTSTLSIAFSLVNFITFSTLLGYYHTGILVFFLLGSGLYVIWVFRFLNRRRELDYKRFDQISANQNSLIQLVTGMQDIKLHGCEDRKKSQWLEIQTRIFQINLLGLKLTQKQETGSVLINEIKNALITFYVAKLVTDSVFSLGIMLSIQYVIGRLNTPVQQLVGFVQVTQDASISAERLGEIQNQKTESEAQAIKEQKTVSGALQLANVTFSYAPDLEPAIKDVNAVIPEGKMTAIVGASGSGKTTLIKLLLGFYQPSKGHLQIGEDDLTGVDIRLWRSNCGVVLHDSFIFSDSILENITMGQPHHEKTFSHIARLARVEDFVSKVPLGYNTKIGYDGQNLSQGQRQRVLIARALYKNPNYLFFDEATNALDASNESAIFRNMESFFSGRTVVVVAHRLSTIKAADKILVMKDGLIETAGNHNTLMAERGTYFQLVQGQL